MSGVAINKIFRNLALVIVVGIVLFLGAEMEGLLRQKLYRDFSGLVFFMIFKSAVPFVIGIIMGIPYLISRFRKKGKWTYDWIRLLTIGVPALLAAGIPFLYYTSLPMVSIISANYALISNTGGIVLGYIILTSVEKQDFGPIVKKEDLISLGSESFKEEIGS